MQITYELTLEDFVEASNAYHVVAKNKGRVVRTHWVAWVMLGLTVLAMVIILGWSIANSRIHDFLSLSETAEKFRVITPWCALALLQFIFMIGVHIRRRVAKMLLVCTAILIAVAAAFLITYGSEGFTSLVSWIMVSSMWWAYWKSLVGNTNHRSVWASLSHLHGIKNFTASDEGFEIGDSLTSLRSSWPALNKWTETKELFLLYISEAGFHMVPKRAFSDSTSLDEFRQYLIEATDKKRRGFPVITK